MRYLACIFLLLSTSLAHQREPPKQQQKPSGDSTSKTDTKIEPLPTVKTPPTLIPTPANTGNAATTAPSTNTQKKSYQNNGWEHVAIILSAVATLVIAVFTLLTWLIYKEQLRVSKINERAWVVPLIGEITATPDPKTFQIQVNLRNNGNTPAWIVAAGSQGKGATKEKPLPDIPPYEEMRPFPEKGSLLSPTGFFPQGFPLSQERIDHVLDGQYQLFIFGYAKYRDIYGNSHITRYCFEARESQDANHQHALEFYVGGPENYTEAD
jgi:hypothetical protein